jgi:hypothetical protein
MHSQIVELALGKAKLKAIKEIEKFLSKRSFAYVDKDIYKLVEHGWYVSTNLFVCGLTGALNYSFIRVLDAPILVKFSGRGAKWEGWVHTLYYKTGFTGCNTEDIHRYTLQYSCEAVITQQKYDFMPNGYSSGWQRGLAKADFSKFKGVMDLSLLPAINTDRYLSMNSELQGFEDEYRANGYKFSVERAAEVKLCQLEIFNSILSKL